ncbi:MAG: hypothetical protein CM15mP54_06220 [Paracoccaceae bacterium]|nr:MAG: hypothetical protein CM15mP54_06220 [Paracoccaceae bacterium]
MAKRDRACNFTLSECHPLVINPGKADLDKKIRLRFEQMIKMGALDEAKKSGYLE